MLRFTLSHNCVFSHVRNPNRVFLVAGCKRKAPGRYLQTTVTRWVPITTHRPSSKVEASVLSYKNDEAPSDPSSAVAVKKPSLGKRIINELVHYYHGFRLLFINVGISGNLLMRVCHGETLSRREKKQLITTTSDVFRLVPFSVFIIVPFMELTLPIFLKMFPNMLPSTFQTADEREAKLKATLKLKLEMAKFLQQTLDEMALSAGGGQSKVAKDFAEFFHRVRSSGQQASNEEILRFCKLFEDEITLDSLSRPQLTALCRVLDLAPIGPNNLLCFQLRMRLRRLAADDKLILKEGIDSLSITELQAACRARGMRSLGVSEIRLKSQLRQWLDLSMDSKVPPSLLLLSRALYLPENVSTTEQLQATIASLPEMVVAQTKDAISHRRGKIDNQARIAALRLEQAKIDEERKEISTRTIIFDNKRLSPADAVILESALESVGVQRNKMLLVTKEELTDLKEELADYQEDIKELEDFLQSPERKRLVLRESKAARRLFQSVNRMIQKLESSVGRIEGRTANGIQTTNTEGEEIVSIEELISSIQRIQAVEDSDKLKKILHILHHIDEDRDGVVKVDEVMKVIELLEEEGTHLTAKQMTEILGIVNKEELLDVEKKVVKTLGHVVESSTTQNLLTDKASETKEDDVVDTTTRTKKMSESNRISEKKPFISEESIKVGQIFSLIQTQYRATETRQQESEIGPLFFRTRADSTSGLNP